MNGPFLEFSATWGNVDSVWIRADAIIAVFRRAEKDDDWTNINTIGGQSYSVAESPEEIFKTLEHLTEDQDRG